MLMLLNSTPVSFVLLLLDNSNRTTVMQVLILTSTTRFSIILLHSQWRLPRAYQKSKTFPCIFKTRPTQHGGFMVTMTNWVGTLNRLTDGILADAARD